METTITVLTSIDLAVDVVTLIVLGVLAAKLMKLAKLFGE